MKNLIQKIVGVIFLFTLLSFDLPSGWIVAGSHPENYKMGLAKAEGMNGSNAASIQSTCKKCEGFGTLMQKIVADNYLGKKVKLSGFLKSEDVKDWSGFWMRVDGKSSSDVLSFDNMQDRAIKGTTDWQQYEIILDVPQKATAIFYGVLLNGSGKVWIDDLKFEIIGEASKIEKDTKIKKPLDKPINLNFED